MSVLVIVSAACGAAIGPRQVIKLDDVMITSVRCFETKQGLTVNAIQGANCPADHAAAEAIVDEITRSPLGATGIGSIQVLITDSLVSCEETAPNRGGVCTIDNVVLLMTGKDWPTRLRHGLGHALRNVRGLDADSEHADCAWWSRIDQSLELPCGEDYLHGSTEI